MGYKKKVFVTGCFDMLHSGHMRFFQEASAYGDLYVNIGSDANIKYLKNRVPVNAQEERKYMIECIRFVKECRINKGMGVLDFLEEIDDIQPDIFIVNEDGASKKKEDLCRVRGIEYVVLKRLPYDGLPARSTTNILQLVNVM